jgi:hypothetical protein
MLEQLIFCGIAPEIERPLVAGGIKHKTLDSSLASRTIACY